MHRSEYVPDDSGSGDGALHWSEDMGPNAASERNASEQNAMRELTETDKCNAQSVGGFLQTSLSYI